MLCDQCLKRPASVHVTKIVNNDKTELHLCTECAREKDDLGLMLEPPFSVQKLLGELLNYDEWFTAGQGQPAADQPQAARRLAVGAELSRCAGCGLTYAEFARTGLLGCAGCYETFSGRLKALLRRLHSAVQHTGKVPRRAGGDVNLRRQMEELRRELAEAVTAEEYERAAHLRDRLRQLEKPSRGEE